MPADARPGVPETQRRALRACVVKSLREQGFDIRDGRVALPGPLEKADLRRLHGIAVAHRREKARPGLERHQERLLGWIANGADVRPEAIKPRIIEVRRGSEEE